mmetsp:Transcript_47072/g.151723  ORF Transcript_47072/g.151723 Transcript_47072/m.151723 type:complete len:205 (-) Transcript_47072:410-1024(-)
MDVDGGRGERDGGEAAEADAARGGQEAEEPARVKVEGGDDPDDDGCLGGGSERVGADEVEAAEMTEDPGDGEDDEAGRLAHLERPDPKQPRAARAQLPRGGEGEADEREAEAHGRRPLVRDVHPEDNAGDGGGPRSRQQRDERQLPPDGHLEGRLLDRARAARANPLLDLDGGGAAAHEASPPRPRPGGSLGDDRGSMLDGRDG